MLDANSVYVDPVEPREAYSWHGESPEVYWDSGVLLKDFLAESEDYDPSQYEILFSEKDIICSTRVSKKRILENITDDYDRRQTEFYLKRAKSKSNSPSRRQSRARS